MKKAILSFCLLLTACSRDPKYPANEAVEHHRQSFFLECLDKSHDAYGCEAAALGLIE